MTPSNSGGRGKTYSSAQPQGLMLNRGVGSNAPVHAKAMAAARSAQANAHASPTGWCGSHVNQSFRKQGIKMSGNGADVARNAINSKQGFQEVKYSANYQPQVGDIMSLPRGKGQSAEYGHVAIWNGSYWVSDYKQVRMRGNTAATNDTSWKNIRLGISVPTIARYTGKNGGIIY